jgi:hypothetical protein
LPCSLRRRPMLTRAELIDKDYMEREGSTYVYVA